MSEPTVTIHHEATRKRSKLLQIVSVTMAGVSFGSCSAGWPATSVSFFVFAFALAIAAHTLAWWDHG